jgi:putative ABC transport system permease protein
MRPAIQYLAQAWRLLLRRPAFAAAAILIIAFGVGANTGIFAAVRGVLLRPLPYHQPESLVMLWNGAKGEPMRRGISTQRQFLLWRSLGASYTDLAALETWQTNTTSGVDVIGPEGAERLRGSRVTPNFFSLLGVSAAVGRTFSDPQDSGSDVAVISHGLWQRMFGADPTVIGRGMRMTLGRRDRQERVVTIIGVLPKPFKFTYPQETEVWLPIPWSSIEPTNAAGLVYQVVGRLRPGVGLEAARADVGRMLSAMSNELKDPRYAERREIHVEPIKEFQVGSAATPLKFVSIAIAVIFLITVANLSHLFVTRSIERRHELAVRLVLGSKPSALRALVLSEGVIVGALSAAAAVVLARLALPILAAAIPSSIPRVDELNIDGWTLAASLGLTFLTIGLAALVSMSFVNREATALVRRHSGITDAARALRIRSGMMGMQIAVVFALLISAGYLVNSLWNLRAVPLGFTGDDLTVVELRLLGTKYLDPNQIDAFQRELRERTRALPGIEDVAITSAVPFRGVDWVAQVSSPDSRDSKGLSGNMRQVDGEYFRMIGIPVRQGRVFNSGDTMQSPRVALISESLSKSLFGSESPIGKRLSMDTAEIVGVVGDVRSRRVEDAPRHAFYLSRDQYPSELICVLVRGRQEGLTQAIRAVVASVDPSQPIQSITPMREIVANMFGAQRFYAFTAVTLALIATFASGIGLAALTAQTSQRRAHEIGIRMALGATRKEVLRTILLGTLRLVLVGSVIGSLLAVWVTRLMTTYLFQVTPLDPTIYGIVTFAILLVCALAAYGPARSAVSADPSQVLKEL